MSAAYTRAAVGAIALSLALTAGVQAQLTAVAPDCEYILNVDPDASACSGAWAGNNVSQEDDVLAQLNADFGGTWSTFWYADADGESTSGTINFNLPLTEFVLALRSANQFSLYYWDGSAGEVTSVDWYTDGVSLNKQGNPQALSGWMVYMVPEPGTFLLMATAFLGMALLAFRRRQELA